MVKLTKRSALGWLSLAMAVAACGGPQKAGKKGSACFRDDDCTVSLVCVAPSGSTERVCTDDVTAIISELDAGVAAASGGTPGSLAGGAGGVANGGSASAGGSAGGGATKGGAGG